MIRYFYSLFECHWATLDKVQKKQFILKLTAFLITAITSLYGIASSLEIPNLIVLFNSYVLPSLKQYSSENWLKLILSIATMLISMLLLISGFRTLRQKNNQWLDKKLDTMDPFSLQLNSDYKSSGYSVETLEVADSKLLVLVSDKINRKLQQTKSCPIVLIKKLWKLKAKAQELLPFAILRLKGKSYVFNDRKVRLNSDILLNNEQIKMPIKLQKTSYFNGLASNEMSYIQLSVRTTSDLKNTATEIYNGLNLFLDRISDKTFQIQPLSSSSCSNHVGISTMAITTDQVVIITGQSRNNIQSRRLLAPSGSGSIDWNDAVKHKDLFTTLITAAERELCEECGINPKDVQMKTKVIGFARVLSRGGKPEFFCITEIFQTSAEIEQNHSDQEHIFTSFNHADQLYKKISLEPDLVIQSVQEFCTNYKKNISASLSLNLRFMAEYLHEGNSAKTEID